MKITRKNDFIADYIQQGLKLPLEPYIPQVYEKFKTTGLPESIYGFVDNHRIAAKLERLNDTLDLIELSKDGFIAGLKAGTSFQQGNYMTASAQMARPFAKFTVKKGIGGITKWGSAAALAATGPAWASIATAVLIYKTGDAYMTMAELGMDIAEINIRNLEINNDIERLREIGLHNLRNQNASRADMADYLRRTGATEDEIVKYLGRKDDDDDQDDDEEDELFGDDFIVPPCYPFCGDDRGPCPPFCGDESGPCPPFCGDDDFSPPPPPGKLSVGGVSLDQTAKVLVDLRDIRGAAYDPESGQLVLIGRDDIRFPPMEMDDLVVTIRALFSGQEPSISIEPCNPGREDGCMKVHYNGRFQLPDHTDWGWVEFSPDGKLVKTDVPATFGTRFGHIIFESDRYLKTATISRNNLNTRQPFKTKVDDFLSLLKRYERRAAKDPKFNPPANEKCMIRSVADRNRPSSCSRLWFIPGDITVKMSTDARMMEFDPVQILIDARFVRFDGSGRMVDVPGEDPDVLAFINHFNKHYLEFAKEKWELMSLVQLAKIVGLVRWIKDYKIPLDLSWLEHFEVSTQETPTTTPGAFVFSDFVNSRKVGIYGGVEFPPVNTYHKDSQPAELLGEAALRSRPSKEALSWKFKFRGERLLAVAMHLAPAPIHGILAYTRTDARLKAAPGIPADFTLKYNSANPNSGPCGEGWSYDLPRIEIVQEFIPGTKRFYITAVIADSNERTLFKKTTDGAFRPSDPESGFAVMGLTSDDLFEPRPSLGYKVFPAQPGKPIRLVSDENQPVSYKGFVAIKKDGTRLAFDTYGRIIGIKTQSGDEFRYEYSPENGRLIGIIGPNGDKIGLAYDTSGQLYRIQRPDGDSVHYEYDSVGHLVRVLDQTKKQIGGYEYDSKARLAGFLDANGRTALQFAYDDIGRVTSITPGSEKIHTVKYDYQKQTIAYKNPLGKTVIRNFDEQGRLVPLPKTQDDEKEIYVKKLVNPNGDSMEIQYDRYGELAAVVSPLGDKTQFLTKTLPNGIKVLQVIDPLNRATSYEYDVLEKIIKITTGYRIKTKTAEPELPPIPVDPEEIVYSYHPSGDLAAIEYNHYDVSAKGHLSRIESRKMSFDYDDKGNPALITEPDGSYTEFFYDSEDRLSKVRSEGGIKLRQKFTRGLLIKSTVTTMGNRIEYEYDSDGRIGGTRTAAGTTRYKYSDGKLVSFSDPYGRVVNLKYDASGKLSAVNIPETAEIALRYDNLNRLLGFYRVVAD